ncbi:hypothetical protein F5I97DRAFT_1926749 [Phlebopus sp. FC_14]|nr:hypothetical protein F5I97DRAFT_1926749 [Phlebopus sp. FC_14]
MASVEQNTTEAPAEEQRRGTPPPPRLLPEETPVAKRMSNSPPFSSEPPSKEDELKRLLALETAGRYVGPMPAEAFLNKFLPQEQPPCPVVAPDVFNNVTEASSEISMYPQFIQSIGQFAPGMEFVDTHNHACEVGDFALKPDVSIYAPGSRPARVTTDFSTMESWVEFKVNANDDPFVDYDVDKVPKDRNERNTFLEEFSFENDTVGAQQIRGQLTAYGLAHLGSQFRSFSFSVLIMGKQARFMRWERAGVVVSRRFNYIEDPSLLADFFWRFSHLSPDHRGIDRFIDPEPSLAPEEKERILEALQLKEGTPLFEFKVPNGEETRSFFGPRPPCPPFSLIGRSTRALPVYDLLEKQCVYLKDTWRINVNDIKPEGEVYEALHKANVPHIAPLVCAGDLEYETVTQELVWADWSCVREEITGHIHYRIVLGVVGRSLSTFESTKELTQAVLDALRAHSVAHDVAKILHRDISSGNIILTGDGRGLLIDWDLSKSLEDLKRRRRDRTGTWQFMSAALLQDPEKRHELQDDLESFMHVLAWSVVRYVENKLTADDRRNYLAMFEENIYTNGKTLGGGQKASHLGLQKYVIDFKLEHPSPLVCLLESLSDVFVARYGREPSEGDRTLFCMAQGQENFEKIRQTSAVYLYDERRKRLSSHLWFINTIDQSLEHEAWPENDGSVRNDVSSPQGVVTRGQEKRNTSRMQSRDNRQRASYHPSHSSRASKRTRSPSADAADNARGKRLREDIPDIADEDAADEDS